MTSAILWSGPARSWLDRRSMHVQDRILKLQPKPPRCGERGRGYHRKLTATEVWVMTGMISRGEVIRRHGREVWAAIPAHAKRIDGRRQYLCRSYEIDLLPVLLGDAPAPRFLVEPLPLTRRQRQIGLR